MTVPPAVVMAPGHGLSDIVFSGTAGAASGLFVTVVLTFFLLVFGDLFLRRLVEILPRFAEKRRAVEIAMQIESDIGGYLVTIAAVNLAVGVVTGTFMWLAGLESPILWGALAASLNFIPIVGALACGAALALAGLLSFQPLWHALLPVCLYLPVHITESQFITPLLLARRFTLNPVLVIGAVLFWYWMWGIPGAVVAVPMLAIVKIVCDRIPAWAPVGHLLGGATGAGG
ncbi:MAG: AI-2E family transporter [Rhodospirillales bacterium]